MSGMAGRKIALAEGRQLEELAELLRREDAIPCPYPMLAILDAPDPEPVLAWIKDVIAGRFPLNLFLTGEGIRRLLGFADRAGLREAFVAALHQHRIIVRGPKPVRELKNLGIAPAKIASPPTTDGVIQALQGESLAGVTVGVQLYAPTNPPLITYLTSAGATPQTILPYVYAPASDAGRVTELIDILAAGSVDAILFTSSPQLDRLFEVAEEMGKTASLIEGLARVTVAAVGPVIADSLRARQIRIDVCPPQGFVMKNLVQQLKRYFESRPTS